MLRIVQNISVPRPQATEGDGVSCTVCNVVEYYSGDEIKKEEVSWGCGMYRGADKSLARPGRKQATEDFDVHISYFGRGGSNGKLPLRTCPGCTVPEPYRSPDCALVPAQTGPRAEY
jgi:hypothetical protein